MQGVLAAWKRPFAAQLPCDEEKTKAKMLLWASNRKPGGGAPYNVLDSAPIAALAEGGNGRPNLQSLCEVAELADLLLDLPRAANHIAVRQLLNSVHFKMHLCMPVQSDDGHWLTCQAKRLCVLRTKLFFTKQYPARVLHRMTHLSPEQLVTVAAIVSKMDWIAASEPVLEPTAPAFEAPSDLASAQSEPVDAAAPGMEFNDSLPAVPDPEEPTMEELFSPLRLVVDEIGIPSIFAVDTPEKEDASAKEDALAIPPIFIEEEDEWETGSFAQLQAHPLAPNCCLQTPRVSGGERPRARPIHHGAVQKHFLKKPAGSMQPTKKPAGSDSEKPAGSDSVIKVRFTHPLAPPRTYVCALLGNPPKLRHVLTGTMTLFMEWGRTFAQARSTLEEAKRTKETMYANWPV